MDKEPAVTIYNKDIRGNNKQVLLNRRAMDLLVSEHRHIRLNRRAY